MRLRHIPRNIVRWVKWHAWLAALPLAPHPRPGPRHTLHSELVVSLTSHPPRYRWLAVCLRRLLAQDMRPDAVVLWLAKGDAARLPANVRALQEHGLTIRECDDVKSYNKLVPALAAYPDAFIVTADDDILYPRGWLRRFVEEHRQGNEILCQTARRIAYSGDRIRPFRDWQLIRGSATGPDVFPQGIGGVMYPPGALRPEACDSEAFTRLCPHADDVWFYWWTRPEVRRRAIAAAGKYGAIPSGSVAALWSVNKTGGNDSQVSALIEAYGMPDLATPAASLPRSEPA
jgi:hypothetical protein